MEPAKPLFSGTKIACARGGRVLFRNLSFTLKEGDVVHLAGPNGAGKTSLLRIMCGALPAAEGAIKWKGRDFLGEGFSAHARRYAFLPAEDKSLKPAETVEGSLRFWSAFWGVRAENAAFALHKMDITNLKDMPVRYLSAGQRRRLSLARVFLRDVPLWLLDEPFNGLDMASYDLLMSALNAHCARGGMAVIASHYAVEPPDVGTLSRLEVGYS